MTGRTVALLSLLHACGHTEVHEVALRPPAAATTSAPALYLETAAPDRPFYEVALLQVVGHGTDANVEEVQRRLVERAAAFGCDLVVRVRIDEGRARVHGFGVCARWAPTRPAP